MDRNHDKHVPLEETLARAAARIAANGKGARRAPPARAPAPPQVKAPPPAPVETAPTNTMKSATSPSPKPTPTPPAREKAMPLPESPPKTAAERSARRGPWLFGVAVTLAGLMILVAGVWEHGRPAGPVAATPAAPASRPMPPLATAVVVPAQAAPKATKRTDPAPRRSTAINTPQTAPGDRREIIHTVAPGETLWSIAARYTNDPWSWPRLAARNGISDPSRLRPGDQVRIVVEEAKR